MARKSDEQPELFTGIDQYLGSPEFQRMIVNEFPEDAPEWLDPVTRRQFVSLMGASLALAGVVGCNPSLKPASPKKVLPYVKKPDAVVPGVPLFFATAFEHRGVGLGVLVKSTEGRPIKVEGNPSHPASLGSTDRFAQASVLELYDPDRSKRPTFQGNPATWDQAKAALGQFVEAQTAARGAGFRVLTGAVTSPTLAALLGELKGRLPDMKWVQYEPAGGENVLRGSRLAFGKYVQPKYDFTQADIILSIDSDYLSASTPADVRYTKDTMFRRKLRIGHDRRRADGVSMDKLNRLYAVESVPTSTGATADHRLPLKPTEVESFVRELARAAGVAGTPPAGPLPALATTFLTHLVADLRAKNGAVAVIAGDSLSAVGHALVFAVNQALGAVGKTLSFVEPVQVNLAGPDADATADGIASLKTLAAEMTAGQVDTLLVLGSNPVFTAPADLDFAGAVGKVKNAVHVGLYQDETANKCGWHIPATHFLETWGDIRTYDGTATLQQPLIAPLHAGHSFLEVVAVLLNKETADPLQLVRAAWKQLDEVAWAAALREGVIPNTAAAAAEVGAPALADEVQKAAAPATAADALELAFRPDPTVWDGRYANNGWLQELPKPLTRLTWDNAAIVSPATADRLGCGIDYGGFLRGNFPLTNGTGGEHGQFQAQVIEVAVDQTRVKLPVFVQPGMADGVIGVHLGYGRDRCGDGRVAGRFDRKVGVNVYPLRTTANPWVVGGLKPKESVVRTGETFILACTQGQHAMEGRKPSRWGTKADVETFLKVYGDHANPKHEHLHVLDFADNPPVAGNERGLIRANLPGTPEERERLLDDERYKDKDGQSQFVQTRHKHEEHAEAGHEHHDKRVVPLNLVGEWDKNKLYRRWAMAFDLGACTGCSACVIACVAENNIPVIGKQEVIRGRIMHWIRIDRYFAVPSEKGGTEKQSAVDRWEELKAGTAAVTTHFQPLACVQCEKAPCELVCPVNATAHSADGLNDMAYNRCVGTRYCANNCPYKVRRFNFIQYTNYANDTVTLVNNPEVTVRTRGVMEKCTYCVQRIRNAEIEAEREHDNPSRPLVKMPTGEVRPLIQDGEIVTACQAACPAGAISFGDINYDQYQPVKKSPGGQYEPAGRRLGFSEVARWKLEPTTYGLLSELNTMPRTSHLAAVKNPNPELVAALAALQGA